MNKNKHNADSQMESRMAAKGERLGVEGLSKQEKEFMYMDNSVVIVWGEGHKQTNGNGKR